MCHVVHAHVDTINRHSPRSKVRERRKDVQHRPEWIILLEKVGKPDEEADNGLENEEEESARECEELEPRGTGILERGKRSDAVLNNYEEVTTFSVHWMRLSTCLSSVLLGYANASRMEMAVA